MEREWGSRRKGRCHSERTGTFLHIYVAHILDDLYQSTTWKDKHSALDRHTGDMHYPCKLVLIGSFSKPRRLRRRERRQTKGLMRTMAIHVRFEPWYIFLPPSTKQQRETPYSTWAESNENEKNPLFSLISIRFSSWMWSTGSFQV